MGLRAGPNKTPGTSRVSCLSQVQWDSKLNSKNLQAKPRGAAPETDTQKFPPFLIQKYLSKGPSNCLLHSPATLCLLIKLLIPQCGCIHTLCFCARQCPSKLQTGSPCCCRVTLQREVFLPKKGNGGGWGGTRLLGLATSISTTKRRARTTPRKKPSKSRGKGNYSVSCTPQVIVCFFCILLSYDSRHALMHSVLLP